MANQSSFRNRNFEIVCRMWSKTAKAAGCGKHHEIKRERKTMYIWVCVCVWAGYALCAGVDRTKQDPVIWKCIGLDKRKRVLYVCYIKNCCVDLCACDCVWVSCVRKGKAKRNENWPRREWCVYERKIEKLCIFLARISNTTALYVYMFFLSWLFFQMLYNINRSNCALSTHTRSNMVIVDTIKMVNVHQRWWIKHIVCVCVFVYELQWEFVSR